MTEPLLSRIYFDTNERPDGDRYGLWLSTSLADIESIGGELRDGLHVIIYMPDELEMEAVLQFDPEWAAWTARPVKGTITYLDEAPHG
jgi:hypothetical protein